MKDKAEIKSTCPECNGSGSRDTGGETPWGAPIFTACPTCQSALKSQSIAHDYDCPARDDDGLCDCGKTEADALASESKREAAGTADEKPDGQAENAER